MMWGDYSGGWWTVMWLSMVVFWGLVILGVVLLVNSLSGSGKKDEDTPDATLKRRLAAGEIDTKQYRELSDALHGRPHGPTAPAH